MKAPSPIHFDCADFAASPAQARATAEADALRRERLLEKPIFGVAIEPIRAGDRIEFDPMTSQVRRA